MTIHLVTIFPHIFDSFINESIVGRAQKKNVAKIVIWGLRDFANDNHRTVDKKPFGGGPGMVMMIEPIYRCLKAIRVYIEEDSGVEPSRSDIWPMHSDICNIKTILMSPKGVVFDQNIAKEYSNLDHLIIICGHYEGIDERVLHFVDEQVSVGKYILSGGEIAANVIVDAVVRLLPDSLGNPESLASESFSDENLESLDYPVYTRPEKFILDDNTILDVPDILLSGHHAEISKWRKSSDK